MSGHLGITTCPISIIFQKRYIYIGVTQISGLKMRCPKQLKLLPMAWAFGQRSGQIEVFKAKNAPNRLQGFGFGAIKGGPGGRQTSTGPYQRGASPMTKPIPLAQILRNGGKVIPSSALPYSSEPSGTKWVEGCRKWPWASMLSGDVITIIDPYAASKAVASLMTYRRTTLCRAYRKRFSVKSNVVLETGEASVTVSRIK